jgi:O-antigen/teichoic acid export membrane protein
VDAPISPPVAETEAEATQKQIRGSSLLLVGRFLALGINFAIQVLIVRYLTKADYGAFAYALSLVALGSSIATFGLDRSITRFLPIYEEQGRYDKMLGTIVMVTGTILSLSLAAILLVYGLQGVLGGSLIRDEQAISLLLILIILSPIQALDGLLTGMFAVISKPRAIFFRKYVLGPGLRLAVVLLLILGESGVSFLATGYVVTGALAVGIYVVILFRFLREEGLLQRFSLGTMQIPAKEVFAFTLPLLSSDLMYMAMNTSDVLLLGHYQGSAEVASFRAIWPAAHLNQLVMSSFALLFTPAAARLFARGDHEGINQLYWKTALWIAVFSFPIFALTFSLAEPFTVTAYGARYEDSATYLMLLSFGYYFNAALGFNGLTLKVFGKLKYIVSINALAAAVNVAINLVLIPRYGALGAAIGTTATLVAHNFLKQAGLLLGTGISLFQRRDAAVYVGIAFGALFLLGVQLTLSPPFYVGFALATLVSLLVLAVSRKSLRTGETFPELMRFRLARLLVGQ